MDLLAVLVVKDEVPATLIGPLSLILFPETAVKLPKSVIAGMTKVGLFATFKLVI